jgi:DNA repair protein RecO (recombination protein O)
VVPAEAKKQLEGECGYVLHATPWRETSLIVEVFSRGHGRLPLVARGARRPRGQLRGVLIEFQPLELAWFGQGEMRTLAKAEWQGGQPLLAGRALLFGYYLNELLLRLLAREDPHPALFDSYRAALGDLAAGSPDVRLLRLFEQTLLREIGYAPVLDREGDSGAQIRPDAVYAYVVERGPLPPERAPEVALRVTGRALLDMARGDYSDAETLQQSKMLMRSLINHYLGGQPLNSRRVFMELQEL